MTSPPGLVFGPVPSRRLGRSLGINNIPGKTCSYACVYCQAGRTTSLSQAPRAYYPPSSIARAVGHRLERAASTGERIDFLTFVPSGEPTLDRNLGGTIRALKAFGIPIAVVTNASLLWRPEVREALADADWVSVKVDAVREATWRRVNRPHGKLCLEQVLEGGRVFARGYHGTLSTETMLVAGANDADEDIAALGDALERLHPACACVSVPVRPPAEAWVSSPGRVMVQRFGEALRRHVPIVRLLTEDEGQDWGGGSDAEAALLAGASIHPMRAAAVSRLLELGHANWTLVDRLVGEGRLECVRYRGRRFYRVRRS